MNNSTDVADLPTAVGFNANLFVTNTILMTGGLAALIGNFLIIAVVLKYKGLREKSAAIHLIAYLAVADGITGKMIEGPSVFRTPIRHFCL